MSTSESQICSDCVLYTSTVRVEASHVISVMKSWTSTALHAQAFCRNGSYISVPLSQQMEIRVLLRAD